MHSAYLNVEQATGTGDYIGYLAGITPSQVPNGRVFGFYEEDIY